MYFVNRKQCKIIQNHGKFPMGDAFDGGIMFNLELHLKELKPSK
jgi:hypothetical protein